MKVKEVISYLQLFDPEDQAIIMDKPDKCRPIENVGSGRYVPSTHWSGIRIEGVKPNAAFLS